MVPGSLMFFESTHWNLLVLNLNMKIPKNYTHRNAIKKWIIYGTDKQQSNFTLYAIWN